MEYSVKEKKFIDKRNYGIDALRLISMLGVVALHVLGRGGVLANAAGKKYAVCWFLECLAFCAVNCYGIISGYVCYSEEKKKFHYRNLLGCLYRENPVKSRNYEAVKSSKKWENVGNSYIIPALLLYRYSYI